VGFVKVEHGTGVVVFGATVVAERAGEAIGEWALAISRRLKLNDPASTVHVYPAYSIANHELASAYLGEKSLTGRTGKLLKRLGRLRQCPPDAISCRFPLAST